jgi:hypothetical protein
MSGQGKGLGVINAATGISLLPETGSSKPLFIVAACLIASGLVVFVAATVLGRKSQNEAN